MPAWCPAPLPSSGTAWRTDGRMGATGAQPEASVGLRSFLAVWPSLVKGRAKCAQGPASPYGAGGGRGPRRDEAALWSHGVAQGPRDLLPGWGWHFLWAQEPLLILQPQLLLIGQSVEADCKSLPPPHPPPFQWFLCFSCARSSMPPLLQGFPTPTWLLKKFSSSPTD